MSFGLVLLATILLVVGLLSDDGLTLIYLSIGASATAAVVLFLAFRLARPAGPPAASAPPALDDDLEPPPVEDAPTLVTPAAAPAPEPAPEPAPAPVADEDWAAAAWEVEDEEIVDFPIADYDDLRLAEIMPLLPQLYSDELDLVYEREANGKRRSTILAELDRLKETGTVADALEQDVTAAPAPAVPPPAAPAPAATPAPTPAPAPDPAPAPAPDPAPAPAHEPVSLLGDDDEDLLFPIADYDALSVSQIMPLLPQLELDELEDVKAREVAGANRSTLVDEIDRYLSGELQAFTWDDEDGGAEPAADPAPVIDPEVERLPIAGYPSLNVGQVKEQLGGLTPAQLEQVLEFESARDNRVGVVKEIQRLLDAAPPATARRNPRRSTTSAEKAPATQTAAPKAGTNNTAFPIADYDELTVSDIRPQLKDLSAGQLRQVRERELSGAGRKTILKDIDNRLS